MENLIFLCIEGMLQRCKIRRKCKSFNFIFEKFQRYAKFPKYLQITKDVNSVYKTANNYQKSNEH